MPRFEVAGGIVFEIGLIPAQPILADMELARTEIRYDDASVIAALSADDLATGERIDPSQPGAIGEATVNPASL